MEFSQTAASFAVNISEAPVSENFFINHVLRVKYQPSCLKVNTCDLLSKQTQQYTKANME
jgi:hypothetical protein